MFLKLDVVHASHENRANEPQKNLDGIETRTAMCNLFEMKGGSAMDTHALYFKWLLRLECVPFFLALDGGPDIVGAKMQATRAWLILQSLRASCSRIKHLSFFQEEFVYG